jgi:hypothetical protein
MSQSIDNTAQALFPTTGPRITNVKFFLGNARRITAVQLAEQLDTADEQVRSNTAVLVTDVDNYCRA